MKKFKLSAMLLFAAMLVFSACGGGGGGSDDPDNPSDDPKDTTATLDINGNTYTYTLPGGTEYKAMLTPDIAATNKFPCNIDADDNFDEETDVANVPARFIMCETEVTYELWNEVYKWATTDAGGGKRADGGVLYAFANTGKKGGYTDGTSILTDQHPVTYINWCDTIVWCNALTEYYNANNGSETDLVCVYTCSGAIIRDSGDSNATACDNAVQSTTAKGFRLPTSIEWEYAARYRGNDSANTVSGYTNPYYTQGNSASGATADYNNASATSAVAVYGATSTAAVKSKGAAGANALGLCDMSGNAWEWCFDWYPDFSGSKRVLRGGGFSFFVINMQLGFVNRSYPYDEYSGVGFRFSRNL